MWSMALRPPPWSRWRWCSAGCCPSVGPRPRPAPYGSSPPWGRWWGVGARGSGWGVEANGGVGWGVLWGLGAESCSRLKGLYMATVFLAGAAGSAVGGWAYATGGWALASSIGAALPIAALIYL